MLYYVIHLLLPLLNLPSNYYTSLFVAPEAVLQAVRLALPWLI